MAIIGYQPRRRVARNPGCGETNALLNAMGFKHSITRVLMRLDHIIQVQLPAILQPGN